MAKRPRDPVIEFEEYTAEDAQRDKAEQQAQSGGGKYIKIQPGKNTFRILPARPEERWKRVFWKHFIDVPGAGTVSFCCPRLETKGSRKCVACERERKLRGSGNPLDEKLADRHKPTRKVVCNAVDRRNEEAGPAIFEYGTGIDRDLTEMRDIEDVNFTHPLNGSDIVIFKTGQGRSQTRYKVKEGKPCRLHEDTNVIRDWIANQVDLRNFVKLESDEEIEAKLNGEVSRDRRDDDSRPRKPTRSRDEDEDEDYLDYSVADDSDGEIEEIEL
jgi:hypothetical protein